MAHSDFEPTTSDADWIHYLTPNDIHALGLSLRQIDPSWTQHDTEAGVNRIWYQGKEFYFDLMFEMQGEAIAWFQFTLRGRVLSWKESSNRIETGETEETDSPAVVSYYAASKGIRSEARVDGALLNLAKAILRSRQDDALLTHMADILENAVV